MPDHRQTPENAPEAVLSRRRLVLVDMGTHWAEVPAPPKIAVDYARLVGSGGLEMRLAIGAAMGGRYRELNRAELADRLAQGWRLL